VIRWARSLLRAIRFYTEDHRPRYLDLILLNGSTDWQEIRAVTGWDMSFFDEEPDFLLVT